MERLKNRSIRWKKMISSITGVCLFSLVLAVFSASKVQASFGDGEVRYEDGRVTVKVHNMNAMRLLERISRVANIRIFIFDAFLPKKISLEIEERPLQTVIGSVLNGSSFAVLYFSGDLSGMAADFEPDRARSIEPLTATGTYIPGMEASKGTGKEQVSIAESGEADQTMQSGVVQWTKRERAGLGSQGGFSGGESAMSAETVNPASVRFSDTSGLTGRDSMLKRIQYLKRRIASGESDLFYNKWKPIKGKYVTHDRELLEDCKQRLSNLNNT